MSLADINFLKFMTILHLLILLRNLQILSGPSENVICYFNELLNQFCHSKANVTRSLKKNKFAGENKCKFWLSLGVQLCGITLRLYFMPAQNAQSIFLYLYFIIISSLRIITCLYRLRFQYQGEQFISLYSGVQYNILPVLLVILSYHARLS